MPDPYIAPNGLPAKRLLASEVPMVNKRTIARHAAADARGTPSGPGDGCTNDERCQRPAALPKGPLIPSRPAWTSVTLTILKEGVS